MTVKAINGTSLTVDTGYTINAGSLTATKAAACDYDTTISELVGSVSAVSSWKPVLDIKKPEVPPETKSMLKCDGKNIKITFYKDGYSQNTKTLLPDIKDVIVYNDKVVVVEFADGTKEKATLHPEDNFSVECGVSICITKKLLGGSSIYNKVVDHALKIKKQCDKVREKKAVEAAEREEIKKRRIEKKKAKKEARSNSLKEAIRKVILEVVKNAD